MIRAGLGLRRTALLVAVLLIFDTAVGAWFFGADGASCTATCKAEGSVCNATRLQVYDAATATSVFTTLASGMCKSTNQACISGAGVPQLGLYYGGGGGCAGVPDRGGCIYPSPKFTPPTCEAFYPGRRFCFCLQPTPPPTVPPTTPPTTPPSPVPTPAPTPAPAPVPTACTGKSVNLAAKQCAAFGNLFDSTGGPKWTSRGAGCKRGDPCSCCPIAGHCGIACNAAGTVITAMCVARCRRRAPRPLSALRQQMLTPPP